MNNVDLSPQEVELINNFTAYLSFKCTWAYRKFINLPHWIIGLFCGNQYGKTAGVAHQYVSRWLGIHPVARKNTVYMECASRYCKNGHRFVIGSKGFPNDFVCPDCGEKIGKHSYHAFLMGSGLLGKDCPDCGEKVSVHMRVTRAYRFCSEVLPEEKGTVSDDSGESAELKNTIYPAIKKWLPHFLIKKDITARNKSMILIDVFGGPDILLDFTGYSQTVQSGAGVQRTSIYCDEEPPPDFLEEQKPRLIADNGDLIIGCTPANRITYLYDDIFEQASVYIRTQTICDKFGLKQIEYTENETDIAIIQAATDDNPTLDSEAIEKIFASIDDPDALAIRRYGIFKQVSGRIFKDFSYNIHYIGRDRYFPDGIPDRWVHGRFIDYHPHNRWACVNISISQYDEAFIWEEFNPDPNRMTTREISREFALMGKDYNFLLNLIDPLSKATQKDTVTVLDDINREFYDLKKDSIGTGGYWQPWDTKSTRGREEIRRRLKNSLRVERPFNNKVIIKGREQRLSTLWLLNNCNNTAKSMRSWRLEEWANSASLSTKDAKESPQQKHSHFPMCIEAAFKHPGFRARAGRYSAQPNRLPSYHQGRR